MEMRWPLLLVPIAVAVAALVWFAFRRSHYGWQGKLPYLARSFRITELPEYRRAIRLHNRLSIAALILSIITVATLLFAIPRPTRTYHPQNGSNTPHVDIMLCFGPLFGLQFAYDTGLVALLTSLRGQIANFQNQRIGMTHEFYRNFPVTADHQSALERMDAILASAKAYTDAFAKHSYDHSGVNTDPFERDSYDPRANIVDTLAACAMGLPSVGKDNGRARMIIYVGNTRLDDDPESSNGVAAPSIYSKVLLEGTMKAGHIQVNAIVPDKGIRPMGYVERLIKDTGGQQFQYTEVDDITAKATPRHLENQKGEFNRAVNAILASPPASELDAAEHEAMRPFRWDIPDLLLQFALITAVGLAACRFGMRL
jgi:Ca-activated chloride channel homolog